MNEIRVNDSKMSRIWDEAPGVANINTGEYSLG